MLARRASKGDLPEVPVSDWLFEGRISVYLLCGAVAAALALTWYRHQRRKSLLVGMVVALTAAALYALLDWRVETDREQIEARVKFMAASVARDDLDAAFRYISDNFRTPGGLNKQAFRGLAQRHRNDASVTNVVVWDFVFPEPVNPAIGRATGSFMVKATGTGGRAEYLYARCEARFDYDPTLGWRMTGFELFDPYRGNERMQFPY